MTILVARSPAATSVVAATALYVLALAATAPSAVAAGKKARVSRQAAERKAAIPAREPAREGPATATGGVASSPGSGSVRFVTDKRAYLDRGARDGLGAGQSVPIQRGGRTVASCTVENVADRSATCTGARLRVGDTFRLGGTAGAARGRTADKKEESRVASLAPLIDDRTRGERALEVSETPYPKVEFRGSRAFGGQSRAVLTSSFTVWQAQTGISQEQIDGAIHVAGIGGTDLRFDAAFSAMRWSFSTATDRFRPDRSAQFYLWEAEVSRRRTQGNAVFAVGRVWPWHTPGLALLDGFQLGRQTDDQSKEIGVFAGLVPGPLGLSLSTDAWTSGAYAALVQKGASGSVFRLARQEARIGITRGAGATSTTDGEALAQLWIGSWSLAAGGRVRLASQGAGGSTLARAVFDLGSRPTRALGAGVHVRYLGASPAEDALLRGEIPTRAGSLHLAADAHADIRPWFGLAAYGGTHRDRDTGRTQSYGTAELRFPRLSSGNASAAGGAEISEGWVRGRLVYAQLMGRVRERLQILARGNVSASVFGTSDPAPNLHEIGGYLHVDGEAATWLRLRVWSMVRVPFLVQGEPPAGVGAGFTGGLAVTGSL